ncbi:MAG TPA: 50S ribosomal protein L29 [Ignavibacteria bacterium]|nr:50S ribosomal protein L29 [Ignavibacteria bacterium]
MKSKEIIKMSKGEKEKKLKELKMELIKTKADASKKGPKIKEIKKIIARILTSNK